MDENLKYWLECLEENEHDVCSEAQIALLNICQNLLKSPDNEKSREVRLDSEVTIQKILPAIGAVECLIEVGYVEVCIQFEEHFKCSNVAFLLFFQLL